MSGDVRVAGVDEAGRGPLAGPVVVAAVVFPAGRAPLNGLDDSKQLTARKREQLYPRIIERALAWSIEVVSVEVIDSRNILQATLHGMRCVIAQVHSFADEVRIDGNIVPSDLPCEATAWVGGDARCRSMMAASILAKVTRDRIMMDLDAAFPQYGFASHKGYGSPQHLAALRALGPCPAHRRSYAPVQAAQIEQTSLGF
ncbi:ribonuclease HII [Lysobacter sp. HDW10]|uniref:ribonuclease HII n=1 Tax=Lysobacter sp. HDW10 TaxID=2714936 RepID=UPI00140A301B|nr:ribonuclease HII [Lysobacter sp. HDW10]QIK80185.1 ribonuclease HII [Lysobacter sp. HDW10]